MAEARKQVKDETTFHVARRRSDGVTTLLLRLRTVEGGKVHYEFRNTDSARAFARDVLKYADQIDDLVGRKCCLATDCTREAPSGFCDAHMDPAYRETEGA